MPQKRQRSKASKRASKSKKIVAVSGGFDPVHIGHVRLFQEAKKLGDKLVVILNNDHWLRKKKGKEFMPGVERKEIIEAIKGVDEVILTEHTEGTDDMSVCREIAKIKPHIFANGGDRDVANAQTEGSSLKPEYILCEKLGIDMAFNVGRGGKVRSSSDLLKNYHRAKKK